MLSVIVTTYNWPQALKLVLEALAAQVVPHMEVIVADDGSGQETKVMIESMRKVFSCPLHHVWQEDNGFQAAKIRNKAIAQAAGEYIIFIDGDCIIAKNFIQHHLSLKQKNCFVAGNRVLLTQDFTQALLNQNNQPKLYKWHFLNWWKALKQKKINRLLPCIQSQLLVQIINLFNKQKWQGAKTCNLAVWKQDLLAINGFDESFTGWGFEDSDLVLRLLRKKVKRKEARFYAPVIHLWHIEQSRESLTQNFEKLEQIISSSAIKAKSGLEQYYV